MHWPVQLLGLRLAAFERRVGRSSCPARRLFGEGSETSTSSVYVWPMTFVHLLRFIVHLFFDCKICEMLGMLRKPASVTIVGFVGLFRRQWCQMLEAFLRSWDAQGPSGYWKSRCVLSSQVTVNSSRSMLPATQPHRPLRGCLDTVSCWNGNDSSFSIRHEYWTFLEPL